MTSRTRNQATPSPPTPRQRIEAIGDFLTMAQSMLDTGGDAGTSFQQALDLTLADPIITEGIAELLDKLGRRGRPLSRSETTVLGVIGGIYAEYLVAALNLLRATVATVAKENGATFNDVLTEVTTVATDVYGDAGDEERG